MGIQTTTRRGDMFTILSIDPGQTTGWGRYQAERLESTFVVKGEQRTGIEWFDERWSCGQLGPQDHHANLYQWLESCHTKDYVIVCERFDFRGDDRSDINLMAREYI